MKTKEGTGQGLEFLTMPKADAMSLRSSFPVPSCSPMELTAGAHPGPGGHLRNPFLPDVLDGACPYPGVLSSKARVTPLPDRGPTRAVRPLQVPSLEEHS